VGSCKKDSKEERKIERGWLHGSLGVPDVGGHRSTFNVDGYGMVHERGVDTDPAVAAYLHDMTHGLEVARR
jgi:hypothetical protein